MPRLTDYLDKPLTTQPTDTPIRIALVITDLDVGGAEKALTSLALGLDRSTWHPTVINLSRRGALVDRLEAAGIAVRSLGLDRHRPLGAVRRLATVLREIKPRLVQSFLFHANVCSRLAALLAGRPPVIGGIRVAERSKGWHLVLERRTQSLGLGWVCVSRAVRDFCIEAAHLDPRRLCVIPNGIDIAEIDSHPRIDRAQLAIPHDAFVALFVGRLDPQKGLDVLLDAMARPEMGDKSVQLLIAGDGPLREYVQHRIRDEAALARRVRWLGHRDDVPGLLKTADVLVLPSRWEGMPNVILEAMAAQRAVIATEVDGVRDINFSGWRVRPEDAAALARAIHEAANDPEATHALGAQGRDIVAQRHTQAATIEGYQHLWRCVVEASR